MNHLYFRALRSSIYGFLAMAALLFVPAGTLGYWQAFVFMAVFVGASATITVYLAIQDLKPSAVSDLPTLLIPVH
jgi:hypothetical protein